MIPRNRKHLVHRWFELELPVPAVGLQAEEPDAGDVDGVLAVDPDEPEGLEQRRARTQANFGFPTAGSEEVHVIRVEHAVLAAGDMNENSMRCHISVVARLGRYAHGLVVHLPRHDSVVPV